MPIMMAAKPLQKQNQSFFRNDIIISLVRRDASWHVSTIYHGNHLIILARHIATLYQRFVETGRAPSLQGIACNISTTAFSIIANDNFSLPTHTKSMFTTMPFLFNSLYNRCLFNLYASLTHLLILFLPTAVFSNFLGTLTAIFETGFSSENGKC